MTNDLVSDLLSLKPLLEAHHCRTDAIDRAIAAIRKDDELREVLEWSRLQTFNARQIAKYERTRNDSPQVAGIIEGLCNTIDKARSALSSVAGGGGQ